MPYNKFTSVRLMDNGKLQLNGRSDSAGIDHVQAIDVSIAALQDDVKRIPGKADRIIAGWHATITNEPPAQFAPFQLGEAVVLVGAETHDDPGIPSPFLWYGLFQIVSEHDKLSGEFDADAFAPGLA